MMRWEGDMRYEARLPSPLTGWRSYVSLIFAASVAIGMAALALWVK